MTPGTGLPKASVTVATSTLVKEVWTVAVCPDPEFAVIVAGGPTVMATVVVPRVAAAPFLAVMVGLTMISSP